MTLTCWPCCTFCTCDFRCVQQHSPADHDVHCVLVVTSGVYSDTHLLAMMYAAELCFWHQQAVDKGMFSQDAGDSNALHARLQGLHHLDRYLGAVNGPLKGQDWTTSRAEEIAKYFREGH